MMTTMWSCDASSVQQQHSDISVIGVGKKIRSAAKLWGIAEQNKLLLKVKPYLVSKSENKLDI